MDLSDLATRLLVAAVLGGTIGVEREIRHKPAGLRTQILITLGAALFTILSIDFAGAAGSSDRIAAQIVTGIGFLGGGAILRSGTSVHGMTTAATIWVNAAIGMASGAGQIRLAIVAAALTMLVLIALPVLERAVDRWRTTITPRE
jgi:putative Mg2+ transporter-C (MgtC) family protein